MVMEWSAPLALTLPAIRLSERGSWSLFAAGASGSSIASAERNNAAKASRWS